MPVAVPSASPTPFRHSIDCIGDDPSSTPNRHAVPRAACAGDGHRPARPPQSPDRQRDAARRTATPRAMRSRPMLRPRHDRYRATGHLRRRPVAPPGCATTSAFTPAARATSQHARPRHSAPRPPRGRPDPSKCIACARTASRHRHGSPRRPERTWEAAAASCRVGTASANGASAMANGMSSMPANPPTAIAALDACPRTPHALQAFRMDRTRLVRAPARPTHGATGACRASTGAVGICTALDAVPCGSLRVRRHVAQDGASPHPSLGTAPTGGPRPSGVSPRTDKPRAPLPAASSLSADCRETTGCAKAPRGGPVTAVALFRYE